MSADFWAGYISGAAGIIIGNPLDVLKVRLQASSTSSSSSPLPTSALVSSRSKPAPAAPPSPSIPSPPPAAAGTGAVTAAKQARRLLLVGTAAPVLGYGALNALLFVSYNRTYEALLSLNNSGFFFSSSSSSSPTASATGPGSATSTATTNLCATWLAGAAGGLATWVVSTPTELVKCRAQVQPSPVNGSLTKTTTPTPTSSSSWAIAKQVWRREGLRGLYLGGGVTAVRDAVGYGFYFWAYELLLARMGGSTSNGSGSSGSNGGSGLGFGSDAARVLLCGGLAGIVTWASIFPLDVIKTRVQTQAVMASSTANLDAEAAAVRAPLLGESGGGGEGRGGGKARRMGAWEVAKETYREGGIRPFFRGLAVCSVRAFVVNAVQWAVYEWIMAELGHGRRRGDMTAASGMELGSV